MHGGGDGEITRSAPAARALDGVPADLPAPRPPDLPADLESSRLRWQLAIDAAGIGSFDWDLRTGRLTWDDRLVEIFGYDEATFDATIEAFDRRVHPDDLPDVTGAMQDAISVCGDFHAEYRIVLPSGEVRWVQARGRALCDEGGTAARLLGAAYDTTAERTREATIARVLETMSAAFYALDEQWRFSYVNAEAERLLGRTRAELIGGVVWQLFPATVGSVFEESYRRAVATGEPVAFEAYYPAPLEGWYEVRAWPGPDGLSVYFLDITQRRRAQEQAERAAARLALLAEVSAELTGALDPATAVARLARLLVPSLADWCIVTLIEDDGRLRDIGWWHDDPALRPVVARYANSRLDSLTPESFVMQALRRGEPVVVPTGASRALHDILRPGEARDVLASLAPDSLAVLPLTARGRTVGLVTLFSAPGGTPLVGQDLHTARDVASRAGMALDNARLYESQRRLAEGLQRSLLTDPPEPDHLQVVVRYLPAAHAAQVGGDWYDAFLQPSGATVLVIGDVVGHDVAAAAAMGQLRGLLRGIAFHSGSGPADVLSGLDAAIQGLQVGTTATAVVARLEQTRDERAGGVTRLRWSNAGHPDPVVLHPDGTVGLLARGEADLLLGVDPATPRTESLVVLERGTTVLLHTDGLVERRGQSLDEGVALLQRTVAELADAPLDDLCDAVLERLRPSASEDDVALVAVRLHPQDRPRPPEAGPQVLPPDVPPEPGS
ncbi:SpoIIE family protein phosphatase [Quadrisphaera sp. DSM 44207]|uniref:SpoIIE family protein phosphatase n=1 Tax=Quadrisphaera sp. DSM 44207 TaxID=1881057 RepID=UPI000B830A89|nr:SpoIIE family protein phosphatase [Quadrisphaera sp. DSM 44207]